VLSADTTLINRNSETSNEDTPSQPGYLPDKVKKVALKLGVEFDGCCNPAGDWRWESDADAIIGSSGQRNLVIGLDSTITYPIPDQLQGNSACPR